MKVRIPFAAAALLVAAPLTAQAPSDHHGSDARADARFGAEEAAALAPVDLLFDGMRAKDTAMIRAAFIEGALLKSPARGQDGTWRIDTTTVDDFVSTIARIDRSIDERLFDVDVRIDGALATVWAEYDMFVDGEFSHCGVDAFQLADIGEGWKIMHIADTRRREGCERVHAEG